jgi:hypothetical protein
MAEQDGHPRRTLPLLAAGGGFITLVEVPSGQPVPAPVLSPHRMLVWMHDDDGDGPAAFPDAAELLASVSHVLIVDAMRTDELVYATASGLAACLNRVVLVETTAGCIAAWRAVAERCVTGRVVVALDMD